MKKKKTITHPGYFRKCFCKNLRAFSLIELMISLIAISLITAAFMPVITKRLSSSEFTIGVGSGGSTSNLAFDTIDNCKERFGDYCTQCWVGGKCAFCSLNCNSEVNTYIDINECSCVSCTKVDENCITCSDSKTCTKCSEGYYIDNNNKCTITLSGTYSPDGINQLECPEGYYCEQGTQPKTCPSGTYSDKGAKSQSDCTDCPQGYACINGTKSECGAGTYSKSGASVCTNCDNYNSTNSAYYSTGEKNSSCTLCEAGNMCINGSKTQCDNPTFATQGSTYCTTCENCTQCDNKTGNCTQCREGYFLSNNKCIECTIGYYCPGGSDSTRHECPTGSYSCTSSTNCTSCKSNHQYSINNGLGICTECSEGYYCPGGTETATNCISNCKNCSNTSTCNTCNNGYYINTSNTCSECNKGYYCENGTTQSPCPIGTYNPNTKSTTSSACQTCTSATTQASTICGCNKGHYLNNGTCTSCPAKHYQSEDAYTGTSCTTCPNSTYLATCDATTGYALTCNTTQACVSNNACVHGQTQVLWWSYYKSNEHGGGYTSYSSCYSSCPSDIKNYYGFLRSPWDCRNPSYSSSMWHCYFAYTTYSCP